MSFIVPVFDLGLAAMPIIMWAAFWGMCYGLDELASPDSSEQAAVGDSQIQAEHVDAFDVGRHRTSVRSTRKGNIQKA